MLYRGCYLFRFLFWKVFLRSVILGIFFYSDFFVEGGIVISRVVFCLALFRCLACF